VKLANSTERYLLQASITLAFACSTLAAQIDPMFTKITNDPVAANGGGTGGVSWADYDGDGHLDLFLPNRGTIYDPAQNRLFRNSGEGSFTLDLENPISKDIGASGTGSWGDFDNDDDLDLFVANGASDPGPDFFYRNEGNGVFTKIEDVRPVIDITPNAGGSGWIDYDNDGWLDLFETSWGDNNVLYRNDHSGNFTRVVDDPVVTDDGGAFSEGAFSLGHGWADVDNDGWLDLFVANISADTAPEGVALFYVNNGNGTFSKIPDSPLVSPVAQRAACAWGDYDNDGRFDLFVASYGMNYLYRNEGGAGFTRITDGPIVTDQDLSVSGIWGDYDNDGNLDLFVVNGAWARPASKNALYHNNGGGTFTRETSGDLVNEVWNSASAAWADYDGDGFLDLYIVNMESWSAIDNLPNSLFRNNLEAINGNNWIKIKCEGTCANRSAIGTTIRVKAMIRGEEVWQTRQIVGGDSWGSTSIFEAHFGLDDVEIIDTIRIEWPGPAFTVQELHDVPVNRVLEVVEAPKLTVERTGGVELTLPGWLGTTYQLQVSSDLVQWETPERLTVTDPAGGVTYTDDGSSQIGQRFYRAVRSED